MLPGYLMGGGMLFGTWSAKMTLGAMWCGRTPRPLCIDPAQKCWSQFPLRRPQPVFFLLLASGLLLGLSRLHIGQCISKWNLTRGGVLGRGHLQVAAPPMPTCRPANGSPPIPACPFPPQLRIMHPRTANTPFYLHFKECISLGRNGEGGKPRLIVPRFLLSGALPASASVS